LSGVQDFDGSSVPGTARAGVCQSGAHPGLNGPFTVLGFADDGDPDVVLAENLTSSLYFEDKRELRRYQWAFDRLMAMAASPRASAIMLKKAIKEVT
jgi:hypothetical protein